MATEIPETRYAPSGSLSIAYQVMGDGDLDLIVMPALIAHAEFSHQLPGYTDLLRELSSFARVITFDKRGQGMSDRIDTAPSLAERADDIGAVMAHAGSDRAVLFGCSDGGTMAALFAATYPEKVTALVLYGTFAKAHRAEDYPCMPTRDERFDRLRAWIENWGKGTCLKAIAPELWDDENMRALYGQWERLSGTPTSMRKYFDVVIDTDIRPVLPSIRVPTVVMHRRDDMQVPFSAAEHLAASIKGARLVDVGTGGHLHWNGDRVKLAREIEKFLTGTAVQPEVSDRLLLTVMFTDIVDSTAKLVELGDAEWRRLLDRHHRQAGDSVAQYRGRIVKNTGDGMLATFDGPGRALQCAIAMSEQVRALGIEIRVGLHTGEVEIVGDDISGIAVNLAARIMDEAAPGEVAASRIVSDLVAGSRLCAFAEKGSYSLKGFPGEVELVSARA